MPFAGFENWDACMHEMTEKYPTETAKKVCGKLKARHEGDFSPKCIERQLRIIKEYNPDMDVRDALENARQFCIAESDFNNNITHETYDFIRNISVLLAKNGIKEYIINDSVAAAAISPVQPRIEPMQTLAEASTAGKRESTNIKKIGYFNGVLETEFHNGGRYVYFVGPNFYDQMAAAPSKGKFLWDYLRGRRPGLVFPTGPNWTPGGVGGSIVPYAKVGGPPNTSEKGTPKPALEPVKLFYKQFKTLKIRQMQKERKPEEPEKAELTPKEKLLQKVEKIKKSKEEAEKMKKLLTSKKKAEQEAEGKKEEKEARKSTQEYIGYIQEQIKKLQKQLAGASKEARKRLIKLIDQLRERIKVLGRFDFIEIYDMLTYDDSDFDMDECVSFYTGKGKSQEDAEYICGAVAGGIKLEKKKEKERIRKGEEEQAKAPFYTEFTLKERDILWRDTKLHAFLNIDKKIDLNQPGTWTLSSINRALHELPSKFQNLSKVYVYNQVTDHPTLKHRKGQVPQSYRALGWKTPYEKIGGVYTFTDNAAVIKFTQMSDTLRHEVAHGIWDQDLSPVERAHFVDLYNNALPKLRREKRDYEANDIHEFFAISFERYFSKYSLEVDRIGFSQVVEYFKELEAKYDFVDDVNDKKEEKRIKEPYIEIAFREGKLAIYDKLRIPQDISMEMAKKMEAKGIGKVFEKKKKNDMTEYDLENIQTLIDDTDEGHWVTIKGRHVFIKKGHHLQFGPDGTYKLVKGDSPKQKLLKKVEKIKEEKRREEIEKQAESTKAQSKPNEREGKIQKYIERTGKTRKEAERKFPAPKKEPSEPNEPKKKSFKERSLEYNTERLKTARKELMALAINKSTLDKLAPLLRLLAKMIRGKKISAQMLTDEIKRIQRSKHIEEKTKARIVEKMNKAKARLNKLQASDFEEREVVDFCGNLTDFGMCDKKFKLVYDFYHAEDGIEKIELGNKIQKHNVKIRNDSVLEGVIARAGPYQYGKRTLYKDWDNLVEIASEQPILPVFGSKFYNSHLEREDQLIGYIDQWKPDYKNKHLRGVIHTFDDIENLSDLKDPKDISVSLSFWERGDPNSDVQHISRFRHVAMSLNNLETDRCSSFEELGRCIVSPITQNPDPWSGSSSQEIYGTRKIITH